ncbi:MAG: lysophospholipid acyltransferase family protein [Acidobacteria bacterium]|nr:lysophospholipid acyltransferase family protein [Acidobacteriota bacterium]
MMDRTRVGAVAWLGRRVIGLIGRTLRWNVVGWEKLEAVHGAGKRWILAFWHGRLFLASWYFRNRGIAVMTSRNRDGEYIARVIRRLGYTAVRGSSSVGGHGAAREMLRILRQGGDVGFAIDGPRGPRYVAKAGAAYLAWKSGNPVIPFGISVERKWMLRSWDRFEIPKPFSRAVLLIGDPIPAECAAAGELDDCRARIQQALDELRLRGDGWWAGRREK